MRLRKDPWTFPYGVINTNFKIKDVLIIFCKNEVYEVPSVTENSSFETANLPLTSRICLFQNIIKVLLLYKTAITAVNKWHSDVFYCYLQTGITHCRELYLSLLPIKVYFIFNYCSKNFENLFTWRFWDLCKSNIFRCKTFLLLI